MPWALGMIVEHICFLHFLWLPIHSRKRPQFVRHCLNGTDLEYVTKAVSDSLSTFHLGLGPPLPPSSPSSPSSSSSSSSSSSGLWQISGTLLQKKGLCAPRPSPAAFVHLPCSQVMPLPSLSALRFDPFMNYRSYQMWFSNVPFFPFSCVCFFVNAIYIYTYIYIMILLWYMFIFNIHIPGTYTPIETGVRIIAKVEIYPFAKVIPVIPCANWVVLLGLCLTWGWAGSGKVWGWPYIVSRVWKKIYLGFCGFEKGFGFGFLDLDEFLFACVNKVIPPSFELVCFSKATFTEQLWHHA